MFLGSLEICEHKDLYDPNTARHRKPASDFHTWMSFLTSYKSTYPTNDGLMSKPNEILRTPSHKHDLIQNCVKYVDLVLWVRYTSIYTYWYMCSLILMQTREVFLQLALSIPTPYFLNEPKVVCFH